MRGKPHRNLLTVLAHPAAEEEGRSVVTISSSTSVSLISAASSSSTTASNSLVKTANGEYTAASVAKDQTDAAKLGLVKETDGNYGTAASKQVAPTSTMSKSITGDAHAALSALALGGS